MASHPKQPKGTVRVVVKPGGPTPKQVEAVEKAGKYLTKAKPNRKR